MDLMTVQRIRVPVIRFWGVLLVPLQGNLSDEQIAELVGRVLEEIRRRGTRGVVIDLSGLDAVDSHICAAFMNLATSAQYMGVRTLLCGLAPDMAMTLQAMGIDLQGIEAAISLERALGALGLRPAVVTREMGGRRLDAGARELMDEMLARNPPTAEAAPEPREARREAGE